MDITGLKVTQCGLRNRQQVEGMIEFVKQGGTFDRKSIDVYCDRNPGCYRSKLISVAEFPDGQRYIADGHHRILAIKLAGRNCLDQSEYTVTKWNYEDYLDINFEQNWVTPFDPRTHLRIPDFFEFKQEVKSNLAKSEGHATDYIVSNAEKYLKVKQYDDIISLGIDAGVPIE